MKCPKCGGEMPDNAIERCSSCARWGCEPTLADISGLLIERGDVLVLAKREECSLPITDDGSGREHGLCNPHKDARYWICKCNHEEEVKASSARNNGMPDEGLNPSSGH